MPVRSAPLWPLSAAAHRVLVESGLMPKSTEYLYGLVYKKLARVHALS